MKKTSSKKVQNKTNIFSFYFFQRNFPWWRNSLEWWKGVAELGDIVGLSHFLPKELQHDTQLELTVLHRKKRDQFRYLPVRYTTFNALASPRLSSIHCIVKNCLKCSSMKCAFAVDIEMHKQKVVTNKKPLKIPG